MLSALDFAETRSQGDAKLLSNARGRKKGERLSEDEAKALRRKVGGTASESSLTQACTPLSLLLTSPRSYASLISPA